jgi:hypothetical protein
MADLHESISGITVIEQKDAQEKDYYLAEFLTPEIVAKELNEFVNREIPKEISIYKGLKPNVVLIELFAIDGTPYKEAFMKAKKEEYRKQEEESQRKAFDLKKANGIVPIDEKFVFKDLSDNSGGKDISGNSGGKSNVIIIDTSGQSTNEWFSLPIARVIAIGETDSEFNPLGIKVGDLVRLPDYWTWKAENPAYAQYISSNPWKEAKGIRQVTKPPMPWIYNAFAGNSGLARDAFNLNPMNHKNHGFIYKKMVTELEGLINVKELLKYTAL